MRRGEEGLRGARLGVRQHFVLNLRHFGNEIFRQQEEQASVAFH